MSGSNKGVLGIVIPVVECLFRATMDDYITLLNFENIALASYTSWKSTCMPYVLVWFVSVKHTFTVFVFYNIFTIFSWHAYFKNVLLKVNVIDMNHALGARCI